MTLHHFKSNPILWHRFAQKQTDTRIALKTRRAVGCTTTTAMAILGMATLDRLATIGEVSDAAGHRLAQSTLVALETKGHAIRQGGWPQLWIITEKGRKEARRIERDTLALVEKLTQPKL